MFLTVKIDPNAKEYKERARIQRLKYKPVKFQRALVRLLDIK